MSLFQQILGNATEITIDDANAKIGPLLVANEQVIAGYKTVRDMVIFTSERIVMIDVQGITGRKESVTSVPFSSVKWYSMENAGTFDLDSEIKVGVQGMALPLSLKFGKGAELSKIYQLFSTYILRDN